MDNLTLIQQLQAIIGVANVLSDEDDKNYYCKGFRVGYGNALAVAIPHSLWELWQIIELCVEQDKIILMQASNTGVTGGSTPDGDNYDRDIIIISTRKIKGIQLIDDAKQVIALPGSTLTELELALKPLQREPHSVIGSSCIGASVIGGVCNNSGGSLIRRGPAFTEKSLFAQILDNGELKLVNHLGIELGTTPEEIIQNLEQQQFVTGNTADWDGKIWADDYAAIVRDTEANTPARFNGDVNYLCDSAGCSGKIIVFAVRLATFVAATQTTTFYIGTNDEVELVELRRYLLKNLTQLPIQAEYIHRNAFYLTARYAKHIFLAIEKLGPSALPNLMANKAKWDVRIKKTKLLPNNLVDKILQWGSRIIPNVLPQRLLQYHKLYEHHLMIKIDAAETDELKLLLTPFFKAKSSAFFQCDAKEQEAAFTLRFGVGSCTIAYCDYVAKPADDYLVSFDVALRRNDNEWRLKLPAHLLNQIEQESCCGHFFCFVIHQDYIIKAGVNKVQFKQEVLQYLDSRQAKYPAEHNIGHFYHASAEHETHFRKLDPTNSCNPGIGLTSKKKNWH